MPDLNQVTLPTSNEIVALFAYTNLNRYLYVFTFFMALLSFSSNHSFGQYSYNPRLNSNFFTAYFENDIMNGTDQYYTNGFGFTFQHHQLEQSPINRILVKSRFGDVASYGLALKHAMYTPYDMHQPTPVIGDRPYASTLTLGQYKSVVNPQTNTRRKSSFTVGVIGKYALGKELQTVVHNSTDNSEAPVGWENQISSDVILQYTYSLEKIIIDHPYGYISAVGKADVGTLERSLTLGTSVRWGCFENEFSTVSSTTRLLNNRLALFLSGTLLANYVDYNSTLEGGAFSNNSIYVIDSSTLTPWVMTGNVALNVQFDRLLFKVEEALVSAEFDGAATHSWTGFTLGFLF